MIISLYKHKKKKKTLILDGPNRGIYKTTLFPLLPFSYTQSRARERVELVIFNISCQPNMKKIGLGLNFFDMKCISSQSDMT